MITDRIIVNGRGYYAAANVVRGGLASWRRTRTRTRRGGSSVNNNKKRLFSTSSHQTFNNLFSWYSTLLETRPVSTKIITSGIICGSGDLICQKINSDTLDKTIDWARTCRFTLLGAFLIGTWTHYWYGALAKYFPGTSWSQAVKKMFIDQLFFAPPFIATFMSSIGILEGRNMNEIKVKLEADLVTTVKVNYLVWVPAQLVNFGFIPIKFQVLFGNCVGLCWNTYMSYKTNSSSN